MRAIKIDPYSKIITEIDISDQSELVTIIGSDQLQFVPLECGINLEVPLKSGHTRTLDPLRF